MTVLAPGALMCVLAAALEPSAAAPIRLQALTATSGTGAFSLLDGDVRTGWRPDGDAVDEGVLFRFEAPTRLDAIEVASCGDAFALEAFVNGRTVGRLSVPGSTRLAQPAKTTKVQSLFVKVLPGAVAACLAEVRFVRSGAPLPVVAPRQVSGRVEATSTLAPAAAYHPSQLFDTRLDFGWVEGAAGAGQGEAVTLTLDQPLELAAIEIWNGYQRSPVHFEKNARARKVTISLDGGPALSFELKDVAGPQKLSFPAPARSRRIRLGVESIYPGTKYPDLALSELRLWDAAGPVGVAVEDRAALRAGLLAAVDGSALTAVLGRFLSNDCDPEATHRGMKLRADGTFVIYERACDEVGESCSSEVFDGTWVPIGREGAWSEIELFGRRHRVDETWDPYAENGHRMKETDRIAGGRIRIAAFRDLPERERVELRSVQTAGGIPIAACVDLSSDRALDAMIVRGPPLTDAFVVPGPGLPVKAVKATR